jgi:ADP-ribosylglycohydrolase
MRAPVIGVFFAEDAEARERFVKASTLITHRDPRAVESAQIIAHAAAIANRKLTNKEILDALETHVFSDEMKLRFPMMRRSLSDQESVSTFANRICRKAGYVTGFAPDSAAVAVYSWLRHRGDFSLAIEHVIRAGGDTDTIAFITGSIAAMDGGGKNLSEQPLRQLLDWPINPQFLERIANGGGARFPWWPLNLVRNFLFLGVVLFYAFRRLLPPY